MSNSINLSSKSPASSGGNLTSNNNQSKTTGNSQLFPSWDPKVDVYTGTQQDEEAQLGAFTSHLTYDMDYKEITDGVLGIGGQKHVRSLAEANEHLGNRLKSRLPLIGLFYKGQHPTHSANPHQFGWVPKVDDPNDHNLDHHRISNAIIINGFAPGSIGSEIKDEMQNTLKNDYGLKSKDITVLPNPDEKELEKAMSDIQKPGDKNSQVLVYYVGPSNYDKLITSDSGKSIGKAALINYVNKYLAPNYGNTSVVLDIDHGESILNKK